MIKGRVLVMLLLSASLGCDATSPPQPPPPTPMPSLTVEGEVTREFYNSFGGSVDVSDVAYHIKIIVKNVGNAPLAYDQAEGIFIPRRGTPLRMTTHKYTKELGDDPESYETQAEASILAPGATETFDFTSDGYTFKLLRDAGQAPLRFGFTFGRQGKPVGGSFAASLPAIQDLPRYEGTLNGAAKGSALSFTKVGE